jgi:hypothetical protein
LRDKADLDLATMMLEAFRYGLDDGGIVRLIKFQLKAAAYAKFHRTGGKPLRALVGLG